MVRKLLTHLEELGFLTNHSGAEFGRGRSRDLSARSVVVSCKRLTCPNTQDPTVVRKKRDRRRGAEPLSVFFLLQEPLSVASAI